MSLLFEPLNLRQVTLKNRILMAPMCMYSAKEDGQATEWHYVHYVTRAVGGVGLVMLEATAVEPEGRIGGKDLGIWSDDHIEGLKHIVDGIHASGGKAAIQLAHAGRKARVDGPSYAPTALAYDETYKMPQEMTLEDIKRVINQFQKAVIRADKAGFDVIEIHGAHGYLINEFLSPLTNKRQDHYGGSLENRSRFLGEILEAVRGVWPEDKPIIVRVTAEDYDEAGNHPEDLGKMIKALKHKGIDMVNVSSGGLIPVAPKVYPGYQVKMAEIIKAIAKIPVIAGGLITQAEMAEEILRNGRADMVFLGRELLRNPYWVLNAAQAGHDDVKWPEQYERSKK